MSRHRRSLLGIAIAAFALAGAAHAETPALKLMAYRADAAPVAALPVKAPADAGRAAPDLANPLDPLAPTAVPANAMQSAVFAKTAVDHRFSGKSDLTGSFGFLCGLQPGHGDAGSAYGVDPHGRFVGAKLSFAFR
jgi:hypothetical protein